MCVSSRVFHSRVMQRMTVMFRLAIHPFGAHKIIELQYFDLTANPSSR